MTKHFFLFVILLTTLARADEPKVAPEVVSLTDAPVNSWGPIAWSPTGGREQPAFVYANGLGRFVLASGMQATGGTGPRHYDVEEFDLATTAWTNAYPDGLAADRPASGPVGEAYSKAREKIGHNGLELFYKDGEFLRLGAGGQWLETRLDYEWCYVPDNDKVYVYVADKTLAYDTVRRTWEDLQAKPRTSCKVWGAMCYDPVNKEIVHAGGSGGSEEVGTWIYSLADNEWRKREFGSVDIKETDRSVKKLVWLVKTLHGATTNEFTHGDSTADAMNFDASSRPVADSLRRLRVSLDGVAHERAEAAREVWGNIVIGLVQKLTPETLAEFWRLRELLEQTLDALATEPVGRARSQLVYDPEHKKMVLFGGDRLDRVLSDTWVYDCATRTWEQRFPKTCPLPRAGHVLAWLPQAKQVVLAGGYSRDWLAQEVWTYDVAANEWKLLLHSPLQSEDHGRAKFSQNCPRVTARGNQVGAVGPDDTLICPSTNLGSRTTWACKVDPSKPLELTDKIAVGTSGQSTWNQIDPASWERVANPDAERMKKFFAELPANQWTAIPFAKYAPGATNRWGTSAYDTSRQQILLWGGGHATSKENDVSHFSLRGGCWTVGYHPDDPIQTVYANQPTPVSFADRPHVPVHAYKTYCFDPPSGKMFYLDRAYDLTAREWEAKPYPGLQHRGVMHTFLASTPAGAVAFSQHGLFRFDARGSQWVKLPWECPKPESIWCDGDGLCYDSRRDCLWLSVGTNVYRYDFATGRGEKLAVDVPAELGKYLFHGETAYLPADDLILCMRRLYPAAGPAVNVVFDPERLRFRRVELSVIGPEGKPLNVKPDSDAFRWHDALAYDPSLKLAILNSSHLRQVFVLRFDRATARMD